MCQIYGVQVNLVTPPVGPKELRITGQATDCAANQVLVTSSVTNPSAPVVINPQGRFRISSPVTQQVQCGDAISVRVQCNQDANCFWQDTNLQVPCCTVQIVSVQAVVPLGTLLPTSIRVTGTLSGCYNDQVVVRISATAATLGPSAATAVDPYTGAFSVTLAIPTNTSIQCDDRITAEAWCAQDITCRAKMDVRLDCPGCARASLSYTTVPCTGIPPQQLVTLNATISIPAGQTIRFYWDYGDGTFGNPFPINNSTGTGATQYNHSETHNYAAGPYTARLLIVGPPFECDIFHLPITVQCFQCSNVTGLINIGPCETDPNYPSYGYRQATYILNFSPAIPQNAQAWVTWNYGGFTSTGATTFQQQIATQAGPVALLTHQVFLKHKPGGYPSSATVTLFNQGQACPPSNVQFAFPIGTTPPVILVDPCLPCPIRVDVTKVSPTNLPCAPTTSNVQFQATIVWPQGVSIPPSPSGYDWVITLPAKTGQPIRQAKYTNGPTNVDTTNGWTGNGATAAGAVDLSEAGSYSVGVTAKFPISAGLPTNADGTSQCNLTGSYSFTLPSCCPNFIGQLTATQGNNPCEWLFSVQVDNPNEVQSFEWKLDGQTIPGTGANNSFTFTPGAITTQTVTVTMTPKSQSCPKQSLSTIITHNCFATPPKVTGCSVTSGVRGAGSVRVTFDSDVDPASATNPSNFSISIGGGPAQNAAPGSLSYDSATRTTTITGLSVNAGNPVSVTVTGVRDVTGTAIISVQNVANCTAPCPRGQHWDAAQGKCISDTNGDEGIGCLLLRWIAVFFIAAGLLLLTLSLCVSALSPQVAQAMFWIGVGFIIAGVVMLLLWALLPWCPTKPCLWGLLITWQILLAFGLACLYFTLCCPILYWFGGGAIVAAILVGAYWIYRCQPSFCQVIIELAPVLSTIIAAVAYILLIPILKTCINPIVGTIVTSIMAILTIILATCAATGTKTKTGGPVN